MKIGVLSDTHIPLSANRLPEKLVNALKGCDLIIHAGDLVELSVIEDLQRICEVKAVQGNMDSTNLKRLLPKRILLDVDGVRIGVTHGSGPSFAVKKKVLEAFDPVPDIIVFGHSHKPLNEIRQGVTMFNPGSATDKFSGGGCTYGLIDIENGKIKTQILKCV